MNSKPSADIRSGVAVIILAGGVGARMQAGQNKVYLRIDDRHMLSYSIETADTSERVDEIVIVVRDDDRSVAESLAAGYATRTPVRITTGGASRHESEYAGVASLRDDIATGAISVAAVHDGARPFLSLDLLDRVLDAAIATGGAIAACAVDDQLYAKGSNTVVDSSDYVWAQTPQAFDAETLLAAHDAAAAASFESVDTAETVQMFSEQSIAVVEGEQSNIKVTFSQDLAAAELLAAQWRSGLPQSPR